MRSVKFVFYSFRANMQQMLLQFTLVVFYSFRANTQQILQSAVHFGGVLFFSYLVRIPQPCALLPVDWGYADAADSPWHRRS
jgi:hypothetical protein